MINNNTAHRHIQDTKTIESLKSQLQEYNKTEADLRKEVKSLNACEERLHKQIKSLKADLKITEEQLRTESTKSKESARPFQERGPGGRFLPSRERIESESKAKDKEISKLQRSFDREKKRRRVRHTPMVSRSQLLTLYRIEAEALLGPDGKRCRKCNPVVVDLECDEWGASQTS